MARLDLTGQKFGRWSVVGEGVGGLGYKRFWRCVCDCGGIGSVGTSALRGGKSKSCGCLRLEMMAARKATHGATRARQHWAEYAVWGMMKSRCYNPRVQSYEYYGARGIEVCDRWVNGAAGKSGFACFIEDVGRRPSKDHSIDRIDNNGHYEPANCKWSTKKEQANNRRPRLSAPKREPVAGLLEWI